MTENTNGAAVDTEVAHLIRAAKDALTDDTVTRVAQTAAEGMDLLDRVNRAGLERAIPALAALVDTGDLDRIAALARVYGSAQDALTDDTVSRLSETVAESLSLLDRVNRSGIADALPALSALVANGDLARLAALARLYASAEDALTDDTVSRMAEAMGEGLSLLDRLNRGGAGRLVETLCALEASGGLERLCGAVPRLADRMETMLQAMDAAATSTAAARSGGGVFSALSLLTDADNQDALRYLIEIGKELRSRATT